MRQSCTFEFCGNSGGVCMVKNLRAISQWDIGSTKHDHISQSLVWCNWQNFHFWTASVFLLRQQVLEAPKLWRIHKDKKLAREWLWGIKIKAAKNWNQKGNLDVTKPEEQLHSNTRFVTLVPPMGSTPQSLLGCLFATLNVWCFRAVGPLTRHWRSSRPRAAISLMLWC